MDLDVNKVRQQNQVSAGTTPATTSASGATNQPINMSTGVVSDKEQTKKVLDFINSAEYKNCPDDQKLELLKQQFPHLKEMNATDLQNYITEIQQAEISGEVNEEMANAKENSKSEIEVLAEQYAKDNGIEFNIDEIISKIIRNKNSGTELSETEQKILDLHSELGEVKETDPSIEVPSNAKISTTEKVIDLNTLIDPRFQEKSLDEKLDGVFDKFLSQNDEKYSSLSDEDKKAYLDAKKDEVYRYFNNASLENLISKYKKDNNIEDNQNIIELLKKKDERTKEEEFMLQLYMNTKNGYVSSTQNNATKLADNFTFSNCVTFLQLATDNKCSIEELTKMPATDYQKACTKAGNEQLSEAYSKISEENNGKTSAQKLDALFDVALTISGDANYNTLTTPEAKLEYRQNLLKEMMQKKGVDLDHLTQKQKEALLSNVSEVMDTILKSSSALEDKNIFEVLRNYEKMDPSQRDKLSIELLQADPDYINSPEKQEAVRRCEDNIRRRGIFGGNDRISLDEKIEILTELERKGQLNERDQAFLADLRAEKELLGHEGCCDNHNSDARTNTDIALATGRDFDVSFLNDQYEELNAENFNEYKGEFLEIIHMAAYSEYSDKEIQVIKNFLKSKGIPDAEINTLLRDRQVHARGLVKRRHNAREFARMTTNGLGGCGLDSETEKISNRAVDFGIKINKDNDEKLDIFRDEFGTDDRFRDSFSNALGNYLSKEQNDAFFNRMAGANTLSDNQKSAITSSFINNLNSDQDRVNYADLLSKINNSSILEGLAQGAGSVKSPQYQSQYVQTVVTAAKSYPQETQTLVNSTLVSQTSQATVNYATNNANSGNYSSNISSSVGSSAVKDYTPTPVVTTSTPASMPISSIAADINPASSISSPTSTSTSTSTPNYEQIRQEALVNQTVANQRMKDIAMENVAEVKQKIDESIAEWELKQELKLTDEVIAEMKEIAAAEALEEYIEVNPTQKEVIIQKLSQATSVGEIYDILLSALGSKVHQKFIDNLASKGSLSSVRAFISSKAGNPDVIKDILMKTTSKSLKSELINMLSASDVLELLENNVISTLEDIDHEVLFMFVSKNIYSMTQTNFANILKYLPFDEREKLIQMRNEALGIVSKSETENTDQDEQATQAADAALQHAQTGLAGQNIPVITNPQFGQNNPHQPTLANGEQDPNTPVPETKFKAGETRKTLSDGRVITNQGTTFAGISNNSANDEGFRIIDPTLEKKQKEKNKDGSPIGMNDEVLTPGSPEWLRKYNRQAPTTAFTMAALDELEEGPNLGSTRVKIGQPIKKKYNPNGFNIRG